MVIKPWYVKKPISRLVRQKNRCRPSKNRFDFVLVSPQALTYPRAAADRLCRRRRPTLLPPPTNDASHSTIW
jgi:hypothetical protein